MKVNFWRIVSIVGVGFSGIGLIQYFKKQSLTTSVNNGTYTTATGGEDMFGNPICSDIDGNIKPTRFDLNDTFQIQNANNVITVKLTCASNGTAYGLYFDPKGGQNYTSFLSNYIDTEYAVKGSVFGDTKGQGTVDTWQVYQNKLMASPWGADLLTNWTLSTYATNPYVLYEGVGGDPDHPGDNDQTGIIDKNGNLFVSGLQGVQAAIIFDATKMYYAGDINPLEMGYTVNGATGTGTIAQFATKLYLTTGWQYYVNLANNKGSVKYGYCVLNNITDFTVPAGSPLLNIIGNTAVIVTAQQGINVEDIDTTIPVSPTILTGQKNVPVIKLGGANLVDTGNLQENSTILTGTQNAVVMPVSGTVISEGTGLQNLSTVDIMNNDTGSDIFGNTSNTLSNLGSNETFGTVIEPLHFKGKASTKIRKK